MLPGAVGGDGDRVAEQDGAGIGGEVRVGVEILGQLTDSERIVCQSSPP